MNRYLPAVISICWCLCTPAIAAMEAPTGIFILIEQRMQLMKDVAGYKAQQHLPIEDEKQEEKVLENIRRQSIVLGLDPTGTRRLYVALINASKAIQYRYRAEWLATPETDWTPRSLNNEVRPRLVTLDDALLKGIKNYLSHGGTLATQQQQRDVLQHIQVRFLSETDKLRIYQALSEVHLAVNSASRHT
ncbi:chorismate mutase [Acerihabitans sp. TG2]|uniref:chorismate mutase n=1 Tax=Acerihabitans sp. TG2 TaxID=3096008 RepID=UPI002B2391FC|nr:chorismate mutase [Acerihabitans sp. TG2]MEA9389821.1 chorismate mutase [Acerihabitans sp. TG2]